MSSSSDDDDDDYVPPEAADNGDDVPDTRDLPFASRTASARENPHVDKLWRDINTSTSVSASSASKTDKLLKSLISRKQPKHPKKRKLREFSCPVLSVDNKKSRKDIADAKSNANEQEVVKFAGVEYSVSKKAVPASKGNQKLDSVLASLDAPKKVSTMEKTSIDWDKFKEKEGIEDELTQYTKDGYIEKQEFLQRLDLKRFEIEKAERDKQRKQQESQAK